MKKSFLTLFFAVFMGIALSSWALAWKPHVHWCKKFCKKHPRLCGEAVMETTGGALVIQQPVMPVDFGAEGIGSIQTPVSVLIRDQQAKRYLMTMITDAQNGVVCQHVVDGKVQAESKILEGNDQYYFATRAHRGVQEIRCFPKNDDFAHIAITLEFMDFYPISGPTNLDAFAPLR